MAVCPVCQEYIHEDGTLLELHVNSHFEAEAQANHSSGDYYNANPKRRRSSATRPGSIREGECPICEYPLLDISPQQAQAHVLACLDEQNPIDQRSGNGNDVGDDFDWIDQNMQSNAQRSNDNTVEDGWDGPARPGGWASWMSKPPNSGDKWWDPVDGPTDSSSIPNNITPGALPALKDLLSDSNRSLTLSARLSTDITHIRGSKRFDFGWGCGYRNALMLISALVVHDPSYRRLFGRDVQGAEPGVRRVQGWIEEAWSAGYDREGSGQLGGKVLGTRKWIGPTDLYAMFSYLGVPCYLVDFPKPRKKDIRPGSKTPARVLIDWVKRYFDADTPTMPPSALRRPSGERSAFDVLMRSGESGQGGNENVRQTRKLPLILQHNGHSRTIVGYEETHRGTQLLLFDPGRTLPDDISSLGLYHTLAVRRQIPRRQSSSDSTRPRKPSHSSSHESLGFTRPYTNGASEAVLFPQHEEHDLGEDEVVGRGGWVKKKVSKVTRRVGGAGDNGAGGAGKGGKGGNPGKPMRSKTVPQLLSCFRVGEDRLNKFNQYQVLVFTGGGLLSAQEKAGRKVVSSEFVRE